MYSKQNKNQQDIQYDEESEKADMTIQNLMNEGDSGENNQQRDVQIGSYTSFRKISEFLKSQFTKIKQKMSRHTRYILKNKKDNSTGFDREQVIRCFSMFQDGCQNILQTFFNIASNEQYLLFQSQATLNEKIDSIKSQLDRSALNLFKRLNRTKYQLKEEEVKKKSGMKFKGKNCKTSPQSSVILQQWLLKNFFEPYPCEKQRQVLSRDSNLSIYQVNNWLINTREKIIRRYLKKEMKVSTNQKQENEEDQQEQFQGLSM